MLKQREEKRQCHLTYKNHIFLIDRYFFFSFKGRDQSVEVLTLKAKLLISKVGHYTFLHEDIIAEYFSTGSFQCISNLG